MKKSRSILIIAFMLLTLSFSGFTFGTRAEAAKITNVMKAPKTSAGKWVTTAKGKAYRSIATGKYAKKKLLNIDGKIYYFKANGTLYKGWKTYNKKRYYFGSDGALVTGWKKISGKMYYFNPATGEMTTGTARIAKKNYLFDKNGVMQTGWQKIGKYYYYLDPKTGAMVVNRQIGKYYVGKNGRRTAAVTEVKDKVQTAASPVIFVGDSRTVGMCAKAHGAGCSNCIAQLGADYSWFSGTGVYRLRSTLSANPTATVIFGFGINDLDHSAEYIALYRKIAAEYPKATIYVTSVNPVSTNYCGSLSYAGITSWIKTFNKALKKAFPSRYIDSNTYLTKNGFTTFDGLHYTEETSEKIYKFIISKI